ncbi:mariner Mos1 transposase [Trichonephila clavipes]|nr:mariner Mos1 transposase [Trichonephila clavipes]
MFTDDEKWVTYNNIVRKRSWSKRGTAAQMVTKPELKDRKVLLSIWWDWKGIVYYELLLYGETLNTDLYYHQLDRLKLAIDQQKRGCGSSGLRQATHVCSDSAETLKAWLRSLMHPLDSQDLTPSGYYLYPHCKIS